MYHAANAVIQSSEAFKTLNNWMQELNEQTYRVIDLGFGYYFMGYLDKSFQELTFKTSFVDSNFQSLKDVSVENFPVPQALMEFLKLRIDYIESVHKYVKSLKEFEVTEFQYERDTDAENAFKDFLKQHKVEPVAVPE